MTTTPLTWLDTFTANLATDGAQNEPQVLALSNGNILVAWRDDNDTTSSKTGFDIVGAIYGPEGNLLDGPKLLNGFGNTQDEADFTVSATDDGGFVLSFLFPEGTNAETILYSRHDSNGDYLGGTGVRIVDDVGAGPAVAGDPVVIWRPDGTAVVIYEHALGDDVDIKARIVDLATRDAGTEFDIRFDSDTTGTTSDPIDPHAALLTDGRVVVTYLERDSGDYRVECTVIGTDDSVPAGGLLNVSINIGTEASEPQVAALANGGWVIVWTEAGDVKGRVVLASGVPGSILTIATGNGSQNEPHVIGLQDGGFFVAWDNDGIGRGEGQRFDVNGFAVGDLITFGASDITTPSLDLTGDGRILLGWMRGSNIEATILDPREQVITVDDGTPTTATPRDTTITGSVAEDMFFGRGGDDTLNGRGGDDTITGGRGADRILAGSGDDDARGGRGDDVISGSRGQDTIRGNTGDDAIRGQGGGDLVYGGSQRDSIDGGAGADVIHGDAQADLLKGGSGDDAIFGGSGGDTIQGGGGSDLLTGGTGPDVFDFNRAGHSPGGAGRDVITDFTRDSDLVDLAGIDADATRGGDQAFAFIGTAGFTGTAGELRIVIGPDAVFLRGDVDGDGGTDFALELDGLTGLDTTDILL